jgi:hypothetical protein
MDAIEVVKQQRAAGYMGRMAISADEATIGGWNEKLGRFQAIIAHGIDGKWYVMPFDFLVNGKPIARDWTEV